MMHPAGELAPLRPLSLGEIFDRAVTLYVRNAVLFGLIVLVVVVPVAVMNYFAGLHESGTFAQILQQVQHPGKSPSGTAAAGDMTLTFGMLAVSIVLGAFVVVAIAAAVGEIYRNGHAEVGASYAYALRRAGAILVVLLCELGGFVVVTFAGAFVLGLVFVIAFLLVRTSVPLGVTVFIASFAVAIAWFLAILLCYLAFAFAFNALGIEGAGAGSAMARGFSRIFNRSELLRATLICLALLAIYIGLTIVSLSVTAVFESMHLHLFNVLITSVISLIATSFLGVLLAVYYFDVRVRREGLDMQAEIAQLEPTGSA